MRVRDRDMDRHAMQSEVDYLFRGLWRGREKGRRAERQKEREGDKGERQKLPLQERDEKEETQVASRKEDLPPSVDVGESW